jgi:hypothetical protein
MSIHNNDTLEPTPQDWGFPAKPNRANQECWDHQEAFLAAYRHTSRVTHAARAVGVSVHAVDKWLSRDVYSFKKRMELARREYCDWVRQIIQERISSPQGNRGSDVLLMFEAKAVMPELYREEVKVIGTEAPVRMLEMLKELGKKELEQQEEQKALEAPEVEGEFREIRASGPEVVLRTPPQSEVSPGLQPRGSAKDRRAAQVQAAREARGKPARPVSRR